MRVRITVGGFRRCIGDFGSMVIGFWGFVCVGLIVSVIGIVSTLVIYFFVCSINIFYLFIMC